MRIEIGMIFKEAHPVLKVDLSERFYQRKATEEEMESVVYHFIRQIDHKKKEVHYDVYYPKYRTDHESKVASHNSIRKSIQEGVWIEVSQDEFVTMRAKHLLTYA